MLLLFIATTMHFINIINYPHLIGIITANITNEKLNILLIMITFCVVLEIFSFCNILQYCNLYIGNNDIAS